MAGPENPRRGILPITAPTPERPTPPVLPKPEARPVPEAPQPKRGKEKKGLSKKARIALAGLAALGTVETTGAIVNEQVNEQPVSTQSVIEDLKWPWNLGKSAVKDIQGFFRPRGSSLEERFPIALPKERFTSVTPEEERLLWQNTKTVDLENYTFTVGFPFSQEAINNSANLRMDQKFDAVLPPFIDANKLKQKDIKNIKTISGLEKGDEYILRYDENKYEASIITIALTGIVQGEGGNSFNPAYTNVAVIFRNKLTGKSDLQQTIAGLYAKLLVPAIPYPKDHSIVYEDGIPLKSGGALLQLTTALQDWDGKGQVLPDQRGQFVVRSIYKQENPRAPVPLITNFLRTPNDNIATR